MTTKRINEVIIVGTEPPCSRCGLLTHVANEKLKEFDMNAHVKHLGFAEDDALKLASHFDLTPGTAKHVAAIDDEEIDFEAMKCAMASPADRVENKEYALYNTHNWSVEMDEYLRPYQESAIEKGVLMTPALIINGELKHMGGVPRLSDLEQWLKDMESDED